MTIPERELDHWASALLLCLEVIAHGKNTPAQREQNVGRI